MTNASSVTRLGDLWKFLVTNILAKVTQIYISFLGYIDNHNILVKTAVGIVWVIFENFEILFIIGTIWSHWMPHTQLFTA